MLAAVAVAAFAIFALFMPETRPADESAVAGRQHGCSTPGTPRSTKRSPDPRSVSATA
jgi:hypothetical protein